MSSTEITIRQPDDWHLHLRDGDMLRAVAPLSARQFARALIMPNLRPPVTTPSDAAAYRDRILDAVGGETTLNPLMTLYLTDETTPELIAEAAKTPWIKACKLYPAGATTNSSHGVTSVPKIFPALAAMEEHGLVLCIHGEDTDPAVDVFDRETVFLSKTLPLLLHQFPRLRVVLEHCTTDDAVRAVQTDTSGRLAATITCHHLLYSRNALFHGSRMRPHMYCLPVLKEERHRQALLRAVRDDDRGRFFLGTDSAPHAVGDKESAACGCAAGVFSAGNALELYAEAFEEAGAMGNFERFAALNGPAFYGVEPNEGTVRLVKEPAVVVERVDVEGLGTHVVPLRSGLETTWRFCGAG